MNVQQIQKYLPHRFPMLLVDRIEELEIGKRVKGFKNVTINEAFFQGHYPNMPIMPGVLILESMAQVTAILLLSDPEFENTTPIVVGISSAKFKKPVVPGDQLITEGVISWFRKSLGECTTVATVNGEVVAEATIQFKVLKEGETI